MSKNKRHRCDICEEFSVWHFVRKSTGLKSVRPSMSSHFSELRDPSYLCSAMYPECPREEWRTESFGLQSTPTEKRCRVRPRWRDYVSDLAWSRHGEEPAELSEISVDREVFPVLLGLPLPRLSPKENRARKWMNEVCRPTSNLSIYETVFKLFRQSECCIQIIKHTWTETCVFVKIS